MPIDDINRSPFSDNIAPDGGDAASSLAAFDADIERYARRYAVDPELVKAIMRNSSAATPDLAATAQDLDLYLTWIENVCRSLREESCGTIYDELDEDDGEDEDLAEVE